MKGNVDNMGDVSARLLTCDVKLCENRLEIDQSQGSDELPKWKKLQVKSISLLPFSSSISSSVFGLPEQDKEVVFCPVHVQSLLDQINDDALRGKIGKPDLPTGGAGGGGSSFLDYKIAPTMTSPGAGTWTASNPTYTYNHGFLPTPKDVDDSVIGIIPAKSDEQDDAQIPEQKTLDSVEHGYGAHIWYYDENDASALTKSRKQDLRDKAREQGFTIEDFVGPLKISGAICLCGQVFTNDRTLDLHLNAVNEFKRQQDGLEIGAVLAGDVGTDITCPYEGCIKPVRHPGGHHVWPSRDVRSSGVNLDTPVEAPESNAEPLSGTSGQSVQGSEDDHVRFDLKGLPEKVADLIEEAWGIIANAGGWWDGSSASPGWKDAAESWRDRYHEFLRAYIDDNYLADDGYTDQSAEIADKLKSDDMKEYLNKAFNATRTGESLINATYEGPVKDAALAIFKSSCSICKRKIFTDPTMSGTSTDTTFHVEDRSPICEGASFERDEE